MGTDPNFPDWWKYTLDLPQVHEAGTRYAYCSANSNLVGAGLDKELFSEFYGGGEDAWAWHLNQLRSGERTYREYEASGIGGSLIPELELVVVFTAGNYRQGGIWGRFRDQIVPQEIIPAIRR